MTLPYAESSFIDIDTKRRVWSCYKNKLWPYPNEMRVLECQATHRIVAGGNRSGKTETFSTFEVPTYLMWPGTRGWWVTINYGLGKEAWRKVRKVLVEELGHVEVKRKFGLRQGEFNFSVRDSTLYMWNGSTLAFKSADNPDQLHAEPLHYVVVDEASLFPYELYDTRLIPRLVDWGGWIAAIGTFEFETGAWFEEYFELGQVDNPHDIRSFRLPTPENPYVDQQWLAAQKARLVERGEEDIYNARYLAIPVASRDRVFPDLNITTHASEEYASFDEDLPVHLAVDPGGVYAVAAIQIKLVDGLGPIVAVIDEIYRRSTVTTNEIIDECSQREWWPNVGGDGFNGVIDVAAKEQRRYWALAGKPLAAGKVTIQGGIQALARPIKTGRFFFHPKCIYLALEARKYRYDEKSLDKDGRRLPKDEWNHLLKALGYYMVIRHPYKDVDELEVGHLRKLDDGGGRRKHRRYYSMLGNSGAKRLVWE